MKKTLIPIGPYHPLLEEAELFELYVEGETVVDMDFRTSYNHRSIEKISESKTFDQAIFLVERVCGICSTSHPIAYVNAMEDLASIEAPERALYIRSIIAELERLHSHFLWLGLAGHFIGYQTVFMWAWKYREPILDICEKVTGNRNHYAMMKIGGVRRDINNEDIPEILKMVNDLQAPAEMFTGAVMDDPVIHARTKGVGVLSQEDARKYCVLGPTARGSNIPIDVRKDEPYAAYEMVDWDVITYEGGDVFAKAAVRLLEIFESIKIIKQCLNQMPDGPIAAEVREIPPGEGIGHGEAPRGEVFHYVRSDGGNRPVRHKIRAPSYMNIPSYKATCIGETISDVALITAAIDPCYCCTERMAVVDEKSGERKLNGQELIKLCQEKTERIQKEMGYDEEKIARRLSLIS
jgi:NADH-quinone oxidoreductase subunit D